MLYKYLMDAHNLIFEESMNRIHFVVTIITILDLVRVFSAWEHGGARGLRRSSMALNSSGWLCFLV